MGLGPTKYLLPKGGTWDQHCLSIYYQTRGTWDWHCNTDPYVHTKPVKKGDLGVLKLKGVELVMIRV
jgi:hypothetical protein